MVLKTYRQCLLIHNDLMETGLDQSTGYVLQLFPCLYKKVVAFWNLDCDPFSGVSGPYVKPRVTRASMDSQEIEICVKSCKNRVFLSIFDEIRCSRRQEMRALGRLDCEIEINWLLNEIPVSPCVCESLCR